MPITFKRLKNGQFRITTKDQAQEALAVVLELQDQIDALEAEHGIKEMREDAVELKKAATAFMDMRNVDVFQLDGKIARLIRSYSSRWIGTKADIDEKTPAGTRTLRSIVGKEMWMKISKRVADPDLIAQAVADGTVDEGEISDAYVEIPRAPYVRFFSD